MIITVYLDNRGNLCRRLLEVNPGYPITHVMLNGLRIGRTRNNAFAYEFDRDRGVIILDEPLKDGAHVSVFQNGVQHYFECWDGRIR